MIFVATQMVGKKVSPPPLLLLLIRDPRFGDPGSGIDKKQDPGAGINIPEPQHLYFF